MTRFLSNICILLFTNGYGMFYLDWLSATFPPIQLKLLGYFWAWEQAEFLQWNDTCDIAYDFNPSDAETRLFRKNQVHTFTANSLTPWVTGRSATMVVNICRINSPFSPTRKDFESPCFTRLEQWEKMWIHFYFSYNTFSTTGHKT